MRFSSIGAECSLWILWWVICDEMCAFDVWRYLGGGRQGLMVMFVAVV